MGPNGSKIQLFRLSPTPSDSGGGGRGPGETDEPAAGGDLGPNEDDSISCVTDVSSTIKLNGVRVGNVQACLLHRDKMRSGFHQSLANTSLELADFGRLLFDHRGRLRSSFAVQGAVRAGSGVWGHELSSGNLAFVHEINIRPIHRYQGLEEAALNLLIDSLTRRDLKLDRHPTTSTPAALIYLPRTHMAVKSDRSSHRPVCMNRPNGATSELACCSTGLVSDVFPDGRMSELLLDYGFRRVGTSPYLAYSLDPTHPSHRLVKECDPPRLIQPSGASPNPQKDFPLHFHILALPSPAPSYGPGPELFHLLSYIRTAPLSYIERADHLGRTPFHLAASSFNLPVLKALLARSRSELSARMYDGLTPLDMLKEEMTRREDNRRLMGVAEEDVEDAHEDACLAWFLAAERGR